MKIHFINLAMVCRIVLVMLIGRVWEMWDTGNTGANKPIHLSLSDGGNWYAHAIQDGYYNTGSTPALRSSYLL